MDLPINIDEIRAGNHKEFRLLIDNYIDGLYSLVVRITCNEHDAWDIVQDTFMKVWEKRKTIRSGNSVKAYIRRIAVNKCYDLLRMKKYRHGTDIDNHRVLLNELAGGKDADYKLNNDEAITLLKMLASKLSPGQKIVFSLVEIEELSHDEVAEITGMSKTSIKSNLRHARQKVEGEIRKYLN